MKSKYLINFFLNKKLSFLFDKIMQYKIIFVFAKTKDMHANVRWELAPWHIWDENFNEQWRRILMKRKKNTKIIRIVKLFYVPLMSEFISFKIKCLLNTCLTLFKKWWKFSFSHPRCILLRKRNWNIMEFRW